MLSAIVLIPTLAQSSLMTGRDLPGVLQKLNQREHMRNRQGSDWEELNVWEWTDLGSSPRMAIT